MVLEFLNDLRHKTTNEQFRNILEATEADIKFNRVKFGKTTGPKEFIEICTGCTNVILRYWD